MALIHAIGRSGGPGTTNPWLNRYIFPGGYSPALSEVLPAVERSGLIATDVEILRLHYADTLRHWRRRFAAKPRGRRALFDERFCRMFELYLAGSRAGIPPAGPRGVADSRCSRASHAVPLTRDYITASDHAAEPAREAAD